MIAAFLIFEAQGSLGGGLYQGYNWENWKGRVREITRFKERRGPFQFLPAHFI